MCKYIAQTEGRDSDKGYFLRVILLFCFLFWVILNYTSTCDWHFNRKKRKKWNKTTLFFMFYTMHVPINNVLIVILAL